MQLYSFVNLGARWGGWSTPRHGRFNRGKENRYPLHKRLDGPRTGLNGRGKSPPPPGYDPRTVQPERFATGWTVRLSNPGGGEMVSKTNYSEISMCLSIVIHSETIKLFAES